MDWEKFIEYSIPKERTVSKEDYEDLIKNGFNILKTNNSALIKNTNFRESKNELGQIIEKKYEYSKLAEQLDHCYSTGIELLTDEIFSKSYFIFTQERYNNVESFPFFNELLNNAIIDEGKSQYLILAYQKLTSQLFLPLFQTYFYECQNNDSSYWAFKLEFQREIAKSLMNLNCNKYSEEEIFLYCKPYQYTPPILWDFEENKVYDTVRFDKSEISFENENFECKIIYDSYMEDYHARIKVKQSQLIYFDKKEGYALYFLESFPEII
tara:strand:+ start:34 stop:837 length:804 start_codon:yes stop_codon:yes gene_type:complete